MTVPDQFYLRVVHGKRGGVSTRVVTSNGLIAGIVGGFVAPEPTALKSVTYTPETKLLQISSSSNPSSNITPIRVQKDKSADLLVEELQSILKALPTEDPPGSEDIYGFNTSITWGSDEFQWCNGGAQGCGGVSTVHVNEEQKAKFKKALEIADKLVAMGIPS